jgi:hypothetical protein
LLYGILYQKFIVLPQKPSAKNGNPSIKTHVLDRYFEEKKFKLVTLDIKTVGTLNILNFFVSISNRQFLNQMHWVFGGVDFSVTYFFLYFPMENFWKI